MSLGRLSRRLLAYLLPLTLAATLVLCGLSYVAVRRTLARAAVERAFSLVAGYDDFPGVIVGLRLRRTGGLETPLRDLVKAGADAAVAVDAKGAVVASAAAPGRQASVDRASAALQTGSDKETVLRTKVAGRPVVQVAIPIWDEPVSRDPGGPPLHRAGTVLAVMPLAEALATADHVALSLSAVFAIAGLCGLLALLALLKKALAPLQELSAAVRDVRAGKLGATSLALSADDEIGALARDFDEMSRSLAQTTVSKDFLDSVFEQMLNPFILASTRGEIRKLNRAAVRILGGSESDWLGRPMTELFTDGQDAPPPGQTVERTLRVPGGCVPVLYTASRFADKRGREGLIVVLKDITFRKKAEEAERLRRREEDQKRFFAMVTHEFRTPLAAIQGFAETLRLGADHDARTRDEFLETIERNAARLTRLVDRLLDLSKLQLAGASGASELDLGAFLARLCQDLSPLALRKGVALSCAAESGLAAAISEPDARRVFENLCANALNYTPAGGTVEVRARSSEGRALVTVKDTGVGIAPAELARIFEPFFRAASGTHAKGTGLGLATVKAAVEARGGRVSVESEPGRQTVFRVELPLAPRAAASTPQARAA